MRRSGRTQVKALPAPQRIDFGQGKRRSSGGTALATSVAASIRPGWPWSVPSTRPLAPPGPAPRRACAGSRPVPPRAHWRAARARRCCWPAGRVGRWRPGRCGGGHRRSARPPASARPGRRPAAVPSSTAARACIRAGISSLNSSSSNSGMARAPMPVLRAGQVRGVFIGGQAIPQPLPVQRARQRGHRRPGSPRSSLLRASAPGRCRRHAPSPRSRRGRPAG